MRKVLYKKWIPAKYPDGANSVNCITTHRKLEGTFCWEPDFIHEGIFHQWANAFEQFEFGIGNHVVALIENPDGTISEVLPTNLKFIE